MIDTSGRAAALWALIATASFATAIPAFSQQPTDAQRSAIRAQCRADYEAHCASVPPGGMASLQCLQKNMSSLAPGCQSAVRAVEAPAEPKADVRLRPIPTRPIPLRSRGQAGRRDAGGTGSQGCRGRTGQEAEQRADCRDP